LLNAKTIQLEEFIGKGPPYAILSHTWGKEVSFQEIQDLTNRRAVEQKTGYLKIKLCCQQATEDGLGYAWVDTCCIDKKSSAELSEATNSMFQWYRDATVCYAYVVDVTATPESTPERLEFTSSR
jgi:Heterokaryon incompatibility protein (HET)